MKRILPLLAAVLWLGACADEAPRPADPAATYDTFGATFEPGDAVPIQAVVAEPAQYVDRAVRVEGVVREVCQQAGCWMTLDAGDGQHIRINVGRKDDGGYAFTMPKDIGGRRVVVQGTLVEETLSVETQRHLAEDAGETVDSTTLAPRTEYQLTASGVLVEKART